MQCRDVGNVVSLPGGLTNEILKTVKRPGEIGNIQLSSMFRVFCNIHIIIERIEDRFTKRTDAIETGHPETGKSPVTNFIFVHDALDCLP